MRFLCRTAPSDTESDNEEEYIRVSNYYSNSSPRIYPRSHHFCLASAEQKKWKFDLIRKVDIVVVWNFIAEDHGGGRSVAWSESMFAIPPCRAFLSASSSWIRETETAGSTGRRRSARKRDKFQERLLLRKGGRGEGAGARVRLNVWRFIGSLKSFTATGKFYMVVQ